MQKKIKDHYNLLKEEKMLKSVMPNATGEWEQDKKEFEIYYMDVVHIVDEYEHETEKKNVKDRPV